MNALNEKAEKINSIAKLTNKRSVFWKCLPYKHCKGDDISW